MEWKVNGRIEYFNEKGELHAKRGIQRKIKN